MKLNVAVLPGDGIGPEISIQGTNVLKTVAKKFDHQVELKTALVGAAAIDEMGDPFPESTYDICKNSDAVLFSSVGDPKYDNDPTAKVRPEQGLLAMRKKLGLFANIRPVQTFDCLIHKSPLKDELVKGADFVCIRELTGGIYFGKRGTFIGENGEEAFDTESYSRMEIERIVKVAFETAQKRNKKLVSIDKANVLDTSRLWRKIVHEMSAKYPDVECSDMLVDNAAMQLVKNPAQFDVVVTSNMFGDILSDEASQITGSIGMLPSASLGSTTRGMYEPIHGSAPDIAGKNISNPIATILSAAMMLRYSFDLAKEADDIEAAVDKFLEAGYRTADIAGNGEEALGTKECTAKILELL